MVLSSMGLSIMKKRRKGQFLPTKLEKPLLATFEKVYKHVNDMYTMIKFYLKYFTVLSIVE